MEITVEEIAQHYSAAMDSVNLINDLVAQGILTDEEQSRIDSNKEHLQIMLAKDFWTSEDLTPFSDAVAA